VTCIIFDKPKVSSNETTLQPSCSSSLIEHQTNPLTAGSITQADTLAPVGSSETPSETTKYC